MSIILSQLVAHLSESLKTPEVGTAILVVAVMFLNATKPGSGKRRKQPACLDEKRPAHHHYHSHLHLWMSE